jgi:hypothetical protein
MGASVGRWKGKYLVNSTYLDKSRLQHHFNNLGIILIGYAFLLAVRTNLFPVIISFFAANQK